MPNVHVVVVIGTKSLKWNVDSRIGRGGSSLGVDVKLVQYLLFRSGLGGPDGSFLDHDKINGIWDPHSMSALKRWEKVHSKRIVVDGAIDRMKPGQTDGSISRKRYKMGILNGEYVRSVIGMDVITAHSQGLISPDEINEVIMRMPENEDVPGDLALALKTARSASGVEL